MQKFSPIEYLKIDIGNHYGLDTELFETKIQWVDDNEKDLEELESQADDKHRYVAAVMAYREVQVGKPTGHLVGLDACARDTQIMSALMRCETGARNTGLIGNERADIYTKTTDTMNNLLKTNTIYERKTIKEALIPHYSGSKKYPKLAFGEDTPELAAFYEANGMVAPGAAVLMPIMLNAWQPFALEYAWHVSDGFEVRVKVTKMDDTKIKVDELDHTIFTYRHEVNEGTEAGRSLPANVIQSIYGLVIREMNRRCNYDQTQLSRVQRLLKKRADQRMRNCVQLDSIQKIWKMQNFVSLVDVEDLTWEEIKFFDFDYTDLLLALVSRNLSRPSFPIIMVHDEFQCHPNYMNWVRQTYIELMAEISDSTILEAILTEITGSSVQIQKLSGSISHLILQSNYALS
jgi:hypothetical protein